MTSKPLLWYFWSSLEQLELPTEDESQHRLTCDVPTRCLEQLDTAEKLHAGPLSSDAPQKSNQPISFSRPMRSELQRLSLPLWLSHWLDSRGVARLDQWWVHQLGHNHGPQWPLLPGTNWMRLVLIVLHRGTKAARHSKKGEVGLLVST